MTSAPKPNYAAAVGGGRGAAVVGQPSECFLCLCVCVCVFFFVPKINFVFFAAPSRPTGPSPAFLGPATGGGAPIGGPPLRTASAPPEQQVTIFDLFCLFCCFERWLF